MKIQKDSLIAVLGYLKANRTAPVGARIPAIALNTLQSVIDSLDEDTVPVKFSRLRSLSSALGHPTMIAAVDGDTPADALVEVAAITLLQKAATAAPAKSIRLANLPDERQRVREINYIAAVQKLAPKGPATERFTDAEAQAAFGVALYEMEPLAWLGVRNGMNMFTSSLAVALENRDIYDVELVNKAAVIEAAKAQLEYFETALGDKAAAIEAAKFQIEHLESELDKYKKLAAHWESGFGDMQKYAVELEQTAAARVISTDQIAAMDIVLRHFDGDERIEPLRVLRNTCCIRNAPAVDFVAHLVRQIEFSLKTFGPGPRLGGTTKHIEKELVELRTEGGPLSEWVDVIILGFDGAWRSLGLPGDDMSDLAWKVILAIVSKQWANERRAWPDWRTVTQDDAIEHKRTDAELAEKAAAAGLDPAQDSSLFDLRNHTV